MRRPLVSVGVQLAAAPLGLRMGCQFLEAKRPARGGGEGLMPRPMNHYGGKLNNKPGAYLTNRLSWSRVRANCNERVIQVLARPSEHFLLGDNQPGR